MTASTADLMEAIAAIDRLRLAGAEASPALELLRRHGDACGLDVKQLYRRLGVRGPVAEWCDQQARILMGGLVPDAPAADETLRRDKAEAGVLPGLDTEIGWSSVWST